MFKRSAAETVKQYIVITLGCALYAAGFRFFLYPNDIIVGGVTGIAMIINYWTNWPVGVMIIAMNVPLFAIAWRRFGTAYLIASLAGMLMSSAMLDLFALLDLRATDNLLLACIYGGVIEGLGLGLIYNAAASTGGIDIMAKFIRARLPYVNFGTIMLMLDLVIIGAFALIFGKYEGAMYAIISMFIVSRAVDMVMYGVGVSKVCYIISDRSREISGAITGELDRGVTLLKGEGAYTGDEKNVILCVIKRPQIADVRRIIKTIDPKSFFIVTDAHDVFGDGFGDIYEI